MTYFGHRTFRYSKNLKSANDNPSIFKEKNVKEINAGRVAGPFDISPFTNIPFRSCSEKESGRISGNPSLVIP